MIRIPLVCCCCGFPHTCCMPWHHEPPADLSRCNCPDMWGGIMPPPPCPVHGPSLPMQVRC